MAISTYEAECSGKQNASRDDLNVKYAHRDQNTTPQITQSHYTCTAWKQCRSKTTKHGQNEEKTSISEPTTSSITMRNDILMAGISHQHRTGHTCLLYLCSLRNSKLLFESCICRSRAADNTSVQSTINRSSTSTIDTSGAGECQVARYNHILPTPELRQSQQHPTARLQVQPARTHAKHMYRTRRRRDHRYIVVSREPREVKMSAIDSIAAFFVA